MPKPFAAQRHFESLEMRCLFAVAPGFVSEAFVESLDRPTAMAFAPDGRLFVAEQHGNLRVVKDGVLLPTPFLSLPVDSDGERGMLGVAFDPAFEQNQHVYVYYTVPTPGVHNRVSRFTADGDQAVPSSEQVLLDLPPLSAANNHNGGAIHFGPDGKLYVAVGDNNDPSLSQPLTTPLGKMLRINGDGTIPADNPFFAETAGQNQAIWATGLRNPFTFAFDPISGRMHINDVGQGSFEEINVGTPGANFGWPGIEGRRTNETPPPGYSDPFFAYGRSGTGVVGNSIAGGTFYRVADGATHAFPASYDGDYFFADFGAGFVKSIDVRSRRVADLGSGLSAPVDVKVGGDGRVYVLEYGGRVTAFSPQVGNLVASLEGDLPVTVVQGDRGRLAVRVGNTGDAAVAGVATIRLLASADGTADENDAVLAETTRRLRFRPGTSKSFRFKFRYPESIAGNVQLIGVVVADGIRETATEDNQVVSAASVNVASPFVNLSPQLVSPLSGEVPTGRRLSTILQLSNDGNVAFSGRVGLRLVATADESIDETDEVVFEGAIKVKIEPSSSRNVRVRLIVPTQLSGGSFQLAAVLDPANLIEEASDLDNTALAASSFTAV
jgi:glucose/arabinose dehydrogenase